ncbi:MAG: hypothetical protein WAN48_11145 [Actinomycetes bacterium]
MLDLVPSLAGALPGQGDCEAPGGGWLSQPVNATSSLAFVVAGLWVTWWARRRADVDLRLAVGYGLAVVLTGIGSADYHGTRSLAASFVHDWGLSAALLFIVVFDLALIFVWERARQWGVYLFAVVAVGVALVIAPTIGAVLAGVGALAMVVAEGWVLVTGRRSWRLRGGTPEAAAYSVAAVALLVGVGLYLASRTNGVLCHPGSLLQGHAVWHVLTALALGSWARAALPGSRSRH